MSEQLISRNGTTQGSISDSTLSDNHMSEHETRQILTPFAFKIDQSLFGLPLASPWKRGFALLIDLFLIAMLSEMPGELLAFVVAITMFRLGSKSRAEKAGQTKGRKRRFLMRFFGAFVIFVVLISYLPDFFDNEYNESDNEVPISAALNEEEPSISPSDAIVLSALSIKVYETVKTSSCTSISCWHVALMKELTVGKNIGIDNETKRELLSGVVEETSLSLADQEKLLQQLVASLALDNIPSNAVGEGNKNSAATELLEEKSQTESAIEEKETNKKPVYSFMKLVEGIIDDLGLGFGWAAFYFTMFTALWQGQTPGKKMFSIKVLQLDGTPLSLSDSFGRYGGYGAGIATGLLGFLQIFWDPNRQAIHDKISTTVVIDSRSNLK